MSDTPEFEFLFGVNPVAEALRAGRRACKRLFVNQMSLDQARLRKLADAATRLNIPVQPTDKQELMELSQSREHQGAVLQCSPYPLVRFDELPWESAKRLVLLDNIEDPHNLGAILRSAEVFGFPAVLLPVKGTPGVYPSVVKASAGAAEHLQICRQATATRYVQVAKEKGFKIVSLDEEGLIPLNEFKPETEDRLLVVIGGEDKSVGRYILMQSDAVVKIPQRGKVGSLNASVAAGIALHMLQ